MLMLGEGKAGRFVKEFSAVRRRLGLSTAGLLKRLTALGISERFAPRDKYGIFRESFERALPQRRYANLLKERLYRGVTWSALREYLRDEDKNSMRFSLESRLPYLDVHLVEAAFALDPQEYIVGGESKYPLRTIARRYLPSSILERRDKMGFVSPQERWQRDVLREELDRSFTEIGKSGLLGFLDERKIVELYHRYQNGEMRDWTVIWRLYALHRFVRRWKVEG